MIQKYQNSIQKWCAGRLTSFNKCLFFTPKNTRKVRKNITFSGEKIRIFATKKIFNLEKINLLKTPEKSCRFATDVSLLCNGWSVGRQSDVPCKARSISLQGKKPVFSTKRNLHCSKKNHFLAEKQRFYCTFFPFLSQQSILHCFTIAHESLRYLRPSDFYFRILQGIGR